MSPFHYSFYDYYNPNVQKTQYYSFQQKLPLLFPSKSASILQQKRPDWIVRPLKVSLKIILMLLKRQLLLIELLMLQLLL